MYLHSVAPYLNDNVRCKIAEGVVGRILYQYNKASSNPFSIDKTNNTQHSATPMTIHIINTYYTTYFCGENG